MLIRVLTTYHSSSLKNESAKAFKLAELVGPGTNTVTNRHKWSINKWPAILESTWINLLCSRASVIHHSFYLGNKFNWPLCQSGSMWTSEPIALCPQLLRKQTDRWTQVLLLVLTMVTCLQKHSFASLSFLSREVQIMSECFKCFSQNSQVAGHGIWSGMFIFGGQVSWRVPRAPFRTMTTTRQRMARVRTIFLFEID